MSQADHQITSNKTGTQYRTADNDGKKALAEHHLGTTAPSYATNGLIWIDTSGGATAWNLKLYDGTDYISLGTLNTTTNVFTPAGAALMDGSRNYVADAGASDTYSVTTATSFTIVTGTELAFEPNTSNTGAATLSVNGGGNIAIRKNSNQALETGDLIAGKIYKLIYDGTVWQLVSPIMDNVTVNAQTGTTYTVLASDLGKLVTHTNASAIAVTLPQAGTSGFQAGFYFDVQNRGAGTVTITPTTSTLDGGSSIALTTGQGMRIFCDGTNYFTQRGSASVSSAVSARSSNTILAAGDLGTTIVSTAAFTQTLTSAVTLGNGWFCRYKVNGGTVAFDPSGSQTIDGVTLLTVGTGSEFMIVSDGSNFYTVGLKNQYVLLEDQKAQGTAGGTFTSGAWRTKDLNTEVVDTGAICTLASNQFTLPAGTYWIEGQSPAYKCSENQARIQNITDGTTALIGSTAFSDNADFTQVNSNFAGLVTITASKTFEVQHQCQSTATTTGFGRPGNYSTEIYTRIIIRKLA